LLWPTFLILLGIWIFLGQFFRRSTDRKPAAVPLDGAQRARVTFHHGVGRLTIATGADPGNVLQGQFSGGVDVNTRREGETQVTRLSLPDGVIPIWDFVGGSWDWDVWLNGNIPMSVELETGANETRLDLQDTRVTELRLKSGASSTNVTLPAHAGNTRVDIEAGAASVELRVPDGVAARIRSHSGLSSISVDGVRFPQTGDGYQSTDYETAANRIDIEVKMGVGSVTVR
jgi:hypothetical protein